MHTSVRSWLSTIGLGFLAVVLLTGCGGPPPPVTLTITGNDTMKYDKTQLTCKAGQQVTLELTNIGKMPKESMAHDWVLLKSGTDEKAFTMDALQAKDTDYIPTKDAGQILAHTGLAGPGEKVTITFTAPKETGTYPYVCTFPGHYLAGMKGVLVVQ